MLTEISNTWREIYGEDIYETHPLFMKKMMERCVEMEDRVNRLVQVVESQKQTFDALYNKFEKALSLNNLKDNTSGN